MDIEVKPHIWKRFEDYCNTGPIGYPLHLTSGILYMEEELLAIELGDRVGNANLDENVEGWNPLFDLIWGNYEASRRSTC